MIKKKYIKPLIEFEELDPEGLCDQIIGGSAHGQEGHNWGGKAKSAFYGDEDFEESYMEDIDPWEESKNYSNLNW